MWCKKKTNQGTDWIALSYISLSEVTSKPEIQCTKRHVFVT